MGCSSYLYNLPSDIVVQCFSRLIPNGILPTLFSATALSGENISKPKKKKRARKEESERERNKFHRKRGHYNTAYSTQSHPCH